MLVLIADRLHNGLAIIRLGITSDLNTTAESVIEREYIGLIANRLIRNTCKILSVTALVTDISEGVKKIAIGVVGKQSGSISVKDSPYSVRSDSNVGYLRKLTNVKRTNLAGGIKEAVTLHNLFTGRVQLLNRRIGRRLGFECLELLTEITSIGEGNGCVNETVVINGKVVEGALNLDIGLAGANHNLKSSPHRLHCREGDLLRADISRELSLVREHHNTLVGTGGSNEDSAVKVNCNRRGRVCVGSDDIVRRLVYGSDVLVGFAIEYDDLFITGIGNVDVILAGRGNRRIGNEYSARRLKSAGLAVLVDVFADNTDRLKVLVKNNDSVTLGVGHVYLTLLIGGNVSTADNLCTAELGSKSHSSRVVNLLRRRNVSRRGIKRITVYGVGVGVVGFGCGGCNCAKDDDGKQRES